MSSDITSSTLQKNALSAHTLPTAPRRRRRCGPVEPVWITSEAFDTARDGAETEWLTVKQFAADPRFGGGRHPSGLQHAVDANRYGLRQSRRAVTVHVRCRGGHLRPCTIYEYALWRLEKWVGYTVLRRPVAAPPPTRGPLKRSVAFTPPTSPEPEVHPLAPVPRPRSARDLLFIPPPLQPEPCGADSC